MMRTYLDCIPCFMEQALRTARMNMNDEKEIKNILDNVGDMIKNISLDCSPPEIATAFYDEIKNISGIEDPFLNIKKQNILEALSLYPELKSIVNNSDDRLLTAIRIAIAGNVIDLGINKKFNLVEDIKRILKLDFAIFDYNKFLNKLESVQTILYLGDNAGESVFDRILIEELGKPVIYVVRDKPIINDVTIEDAIASGLDEVAHIISSGCPAPATILSMCNDDFLNHFDNAQLIISKGQGNYEGLSDVKAPIFFMLIAKCKVIAKDLNVKVNDIVLKAGNFI